MPLLRVAGAVAAFPATSLYHAADFTVVRQAMSDENKIRDAAGAVKGLVEAVPVYHNKMDTLFALVS